MFVLLICLRATQENTEEFDGPLHNKELTTARIVLEGEGGLRSATARGQGQLLMMAAFAAAAVPGDDPEADEFQRYAFELFLGWRMLCVQSATQRQTCQVVAGLSLMARQFSCSDGSSWQDERYPCLPHRKFDVSMSHVRYAGSETVSSSCPCPLHCHCKSANAQVTAPQLLSHAPCNLSFASRQQT